MAGSDFVAIDNALRTHFARLTWERRGYEKGYNDGLKECAASDVIMAKKMIQDGFPLRSVRKYTNLPIGQINRLLKDANRVKDGDCNEA